MSSARLDCIKHLREVLAVKPDPSLPMKTQDEQAAGRHRITTGLRQSIVQIGVDELRRRFGHAAIIKGDVYELPPTARTRRYMAQVQVRGSEGGAVTFQDDLMKFPSDETIAQIALVV